MSFYFLNQNFIDLDVVSNNYVSSEQAAFPVTNVYNKQRRSKVWRSNGFWSVASGDNTIVFRETVAVDLTATIAVGEYSSSVTFLAAIKTALDAAGASTYTVTQDATTGKIKIQSDGTGGGGIFQLMWTDANSLDMGELMGFDTSANQTGALTYSADILRIHSNEWVKWDLGISSNPHGFVLVGPRNAPLKITPTAVIKIQGNETDNWTAPSYEQSLTYDDAVISLFSATGLHTEPLRYWRFYVEDKDNPLGYIEIGAMFLGDYYETTRGKAQFPFQTSQIDRSDTVFSEGGQTFSDIRQKTEGFSVTFAALTIAEREQIEAIFYEFGRSTPLFIAFDPDECFTLSATKSIRYVKFEGDPKTTLVSPNNYTMTFSLREEL